MRIVEAKLLPLSRGELKGALELMDTIEGAFGDLRHAEAVPLVAKMQELRDVVCESLPGGLFTYCEACELPIGCDEESASSDDGVTICAECLKHHETASATAA